MEAYCCRLLTSHGGPSNAVNKHRWGFPRGLVGKNLPAKQEMQVPSLGREAPLEEEIATHYSVLAWEIPGTEEPGRLDSMGYQELVTTQ